MNQKTKINRRVIVKLTKQQYFLELIVTDNGSGISPEDQNRIFDPFFTTKSKHTGMGLGLSTTKTIIEKDFHGEIEVQSFLDLGSTFKVKIPC